MSPAIVSVVWCLNAVSRYYARGGAQTEPTNLKEFKRWRLESRKAVAARIWGAEDQRGGSCRERERERSRDLQREPLKSLAEYCSEHAWVKLQEAGEESPKSRVPNNSWSSHRTGNILSSHKPKWRDLLMYEALARALKRGLSIGGKLALDSKLSWTFLNTA